MECATAPWGVVMHAEPTDVPPLLQVSPSKYRGLHVTYYRNPVKDSTNYSNFCFFQYSYDLTKSAIEVKIYCDFTGPKPAFVVGQVKPDWVKCADPLLRVEFQEKPWERKVLSSACVTQNTVKYALPFVVGEYPCLDVRCKNGKASIVFDFGPDNKQSTIIDFFNDLAAQS